MRCPDCDSLWTKDVIDWMYAREFEYYVCPYCAYRDEKNKLPKRFGDQRFLKYARQVA